MPFPLGKRVGGDNGGLQGTVVVFFSDRPPLLVYRVAQPPLHLGRNVAQPLTGRGVGVAAVAFSFVVLVPRVRALPPPLVHRHRRLGHVKLVAVLPVLLLVAVRRQVVVDIGRFALKPALPVRQQPAPAPPPVVAQKVQLAL